MESADGSQKRASVIVGVQLWGRMIIGRGGWVGSMKQDVGTSGSHNPRL